MPFFIISDSYVFTIFDYLYIIELKKGSPQFFSVVIDGGRKDSADIVRLKKYFAEFDSETETSKIKLGPDD